MDLGPVEYAIVAFPGSEMTGVMVPAIGDLVSRGVIRLIDLRLVERLPDGSLRTLGLETLPAEERAAYGALDPRFVDLLGALDLEELVDSLPPGSSAAVMVWEDTWAMGLAETLRAGHGVLVDRQTVPHEVVRAALEALDAPGDSAR
ncbi:MAG TPA: DUF6325 family protein [Actinospica sp.]|nr:DUF6325 family protein [Actinospica sp.]